MSIRTSAPSEADIRRLFATSLAPASLVPLAGLILWLDGGLPQGRLGLAAAPADPRLAAFDGGVEPLPDGLLVKFCPLSHANARALRTLLPWLAPRPLGLATSAGFGDRLGLATPGHVLALQHALADAPGATLLPIFAQQSIREMTRTGRSPDDVMADATWGTLLGGWRGGVGADADHLKTTDDIDRCVAAGFSFYTVDPGAYVDNDADTDPAATIRAKVDALPWADLASAPADLARRYVGRVVDLGNRTLTLDEASVLRGAAKYGAAIAHVSRMARHLVATGARAELEVSVDETETPTTLQEHVLFVSELTRLGVRWVSLAPRFVGRFEKGVDYIGDLDALRADLAGHAAIARALGPYKLSLHSGSDKFSVYPLIVAATDGLVHLKTAGTSYLEALRVVADVDPPLFRDIATLAREVYPRDRASYHVSADLARVPSIAALSDAELPGLLDQFDAREVLHVTFGTALAEYGDRLKSLLAANPDAYAATLERHFYRHLAPFVGI